MVLVARIWHENEPSLRLFRRAGFALRESADGVEDWAMSVELDVLDR